MARPYRIEFPGAVYHLTARGNARQSIYLDDEDRKRFIRVLGREVEQQRWRCYAYCLMRNHYHLLLETPEGNLVAGMRRLNAVYTQSFNRRHRRVGHVLQGRYKSIVVDRDSYLLELCRYVVLNPVRAGAMKRPADWPWSSYQGTAGLAKGPEWLEVNWVLSQFGRRIARARKAYRQFVAEGVQASSPWEGLRGQMWLGSEEFLTRMQGLVKKGKITDIPKEQRQPGRPTPKDVMRAVGRVYGVGEKGLRDRLDPKAYKAAVYLLRRVAGVGIGEVGEIFGISGSRVSKIQRGIEDGEVNLGLRTLLREYNVNRLTENVWID